VPIRSGSRRGGLRPYTDLFEVHPPYFVLLTPILEHWTDPCDALRALRIFAALGNLAFLGGLVALGRTVAPRCGRWAGLGVAFVAFHPKVLDFLVEFRIDGWGYAPAAWGLVGFLRRPGMRGRFATFGILSGIATLLCPKLALLPPLVVGFEILRECRSWREALRMGSAYALGLGIAALVFASYLAANGIALDRTYLLLFRYHTLSNAHSSYRHGLLRQLVGTPLLLVPIALGALAWAIDAVKRRSLAGAYPPALGLWLVIQAWLVAYPYKQYHAPWFLFGSAFVILLGRALDDLWRHARHPGLLRRVRDDDRLGPGHRAALGAFQPRPGAMRHDPRLEPARGPRGPNRGAPPFSSDRPARRLLPLVQHVRPQRLRLGADPGGPATLSAARLSRAERGGAPGLPARLRHP